MCVFESIEVATRNPGYVHLKEVRLATWNPGSLYNLLLLLASLCAARTWEPLNLCLGLKLEIFFWNFLPVSFFLCPQQEESKHYSLFFFVNIFLRDFFFDSHNFTLFASSDVFNVFFLLLLTVVGLQVDWAAVLGDLKKTKWDRSA